MNPEISATDRPIDRLSRDIRLNAVADTLQPIVQGVVDATGGESSLMSDLLHGRWLGHALHPLVTDIPIGAWSMTAAFDVMAARRSRSLEPGADAALVIGIAGSVAAAATGFAEWSDTVDEPRRLGAAHAVLNSSALACYVVSFLRSAVTVAAAPARFRNVIALGIALLLSVAAMAKANVPLQTLPSCPSTDPVVWINTNSKIYHVQGDRFFGKTKAGVFACTSKAIASGARASEPGSKHAGSMMASPLPTARAIRPEKHRFIGTQPTAMPIATAVPMATPTPAAHKRRHKRSPSPQPTDF